MQLSIIFSLFHTVKVLIGELKIEKKFLKQSLHVYFKPNYVP